MSFLYRLAKMKLEMAKMKLEMAKMKLEMAKIEELEPDWVSEGFVAEAWMGLSSPNFPNNQYLYK